jgi:hypothetical protein
MSFGHSVIGNIIGKKIGKDKMSKNNDRVNVGKLSYNELKHDLTECPNCAKGFFISDKSNPYSQKHKSYFCSEKCKKEFKG